MQKLVIQAEFNVTTLQELLNIIQALVNKNVEVKAIWTEG